MKFIENNTYTLQTDYYNSVKVVCTWANATSAYFAVEGTGVANYKLDKKYNKLYHWSNTYSSWDSIDHTLSEETLDDVWSIRMGSQSYSYDGMNQGD